MSPQVSAYIGLGSNLDDPRAQIERAVSAIGELPQSRVGRMSRLYASVPWGVADQPEFVNAAVELQTSLAAHALLDSLLGIEQQVGRRRDGLRWGPRRIDLDILVYGDRCVDEPGLQVPHPHLHERAFALEPLFQIAPDLVIPGCGPVAALLAAVDRSGCRPLERHGATTE